MSNEKQTRKVFYIDPMSMRNLARYDYNLLNGMELQVYYFCSRQYDYKTLSGIRYRKVFCYNGIKPVALKVTSYLLSYLVIFFYTLMVRPDIIHVQWCKIPKTDSLYMRLAKVLTGARIVHTAHNVLPHNTGLRYKGIYTYIYGMVDALIVHSRRTKEEIVSQFAVAPDKIHVIRHGIIGMDERAEPASAYDAYKCLDGRFVITSLGEQSYYKGIDVLADVWLSTPELCHAKDLMLVIVGKNKGLDLSPLSKADNVYVKDEKIPDEEYMYLVRHTDVYMLPYREISQSGALLTIMAEHIPVVVTDVGGIADPFEYGRIGWIVPRLTKEALRETLLSIVGNKEEARRIKGDGATWQRVNAHYDWCEINRQTQWLYESL